MVSSGGSFRGPLGIALAPNGIIYVVDSTETAGHGVVFMIDPTVGNVPPGHNQTVVSTDGLMTEPGGIALGADGSIYLTNGSCGCGPIARVIKINPANGQQSVMSEGGLFDNPAAPFSPTGVTVAPDGLLYVTDPFYFDASGNGAVMRVNPSLPPTSNQTLVASGTPFGSPFGLAFGADGMLYVADAQCCTPISYGFGGVIKVDLTNTNPTTNHTIVSDNRNDDVYIQPVAVALTANGRFYVADSSCCGGDPLSGDLPGGVLRVNPANGDVVPRFVGGEFSNQNGGPNGVAVVPEDRSRMPAP